MKKLIIIAAIMVAGVASGYSQDAKSVIDRYMKATNMASIEQNRDQSEKIDMSVSSNQGGMEMTIDMKVISRDAGKKMRIEIDMMGQQIVTVLSGENGWIKIGGNVTPLPSSQIEKAKSQVNVMGSLIWEESKYDFEYLGLQDEYEVLKITPKDEKDREIAQSYKAKFNKTTGLLEKMDVEMQGITDMVNTVSDYKQFGKITIPTKIVVTMSGEVISSVVITDYELNCTTNDQMFEEPK